MNLPNPHLEDRPRLYFNIDGVGELGIGFMLASGAAILWQQAHSAPDSIWNRSSTFLILWLLIIAVIHYGTRAIKNHFTYLRTGYVEYRKRDQVWIPVILGAAVAALSGAGLAIAVRHHWDLTAVAALVGVVFAARYAYAFVRTAPWKWAVAGAMAVASVAVIVIPAEWLERLAGGVGLRGTLVYFVAVYGCIFLISGAISFWLYLRHTQPPVAEDQ